jgi:hypothetical protein
MSKKKNRKKNVFGSVLLHPKMACVHARTTQTLSDNENSFCHAQQ